MHILQIKEWGKSGKDNSNRNQKGEEEAESCKFWVILYVLGRTLNQVAEDITFFLPSSLKTFGFL